MSDPLVTAVMIHGKCPDRRPFAMAAIKSYTLQTYKPMELIIINHSDSPLTAGFSEEIDDGITEVMVDSQPSLGDYRNIALEEAKGDFIICFDDDDWSHPHRVRTQVDQAIKHNCPVTLRNQIRYSFRTGNAFSYKVKLRPGYDVGIPGTVCHPRADWRYPSEDRHEDTHYLQKFPKVKILENVPQLYLRFFTGYNVWHEEHIMGQYAFGTDRVDLGQTTRSYLKEVLNTHYRFALKAA